MYGELGLKNGIPTKKQTEQVIGSYNFNGNALEIFEMFFGSTNPYLGF